MPVDRIPPSEHASRRKKVITGLKGAVGVLFAGDHDPHSETPFRPRAHFEYLTGVVDEPRAILLLDPANPVAERRSMLILSPLDPERNRWDGDRSEISKTLRERTGFVAIFRTGALPRLLNAAVARSRRLACLHPPAHYNQPLSPDLALFRKVIERTPGVSIEDRSDLLEKMRSVKSRAEIELVQRAIDITVIGFEAMMRTARPKLNEFELQETIEHAYRSNGARAAAFPTIVGSGLNSTVLHYVANDQPMADGDLVCVDSGAVFGGYAADVTRTVPVGGSFAPRQREIYNLVLKAETAAIKAVKPGVTFDQIDRAARQVIESAGHGDHFIHSIGHHLGLETHDVSPDEALKPGAVITIEPGIYIPDEKIGVRVEDDILVTQGGCRNMSAAIPKTVAAVEKTMKS